MTREQEVEIYEVRERMLSDPDFRAYRTATCRTIRREELTSIERATMLQAVRKKFGWEGEAGSVELAWFFQIGPPGMLTRIEKLLTPEAKAKPVVDKLARPIYDGGRRSDGLYPHLSRTKLAKSCGVTVSYISSILRGGCDQTCLSGR